jgi:NAD(P)-dependent dehydrogenase (short-subunit alcohol dehydrogenase family)
MPRSPTVVLTGATTGIGRAAALAIAFNELWETVSPGG